MRKSNFALRLQPSLLDEARKLADAEDVALISSSTWQLRKRSRPCGSNSNLNQIRGSRIAAQRRDELDRYRVAT